MKIIKRSGKENHRCSYKSKQRSGGEGQAFSGTDGRNRRADYRFLRTHGQNL